MGPKRNPWTPAPRNGDNAQTAAAFTFHSRSGAGHQWDVIRNCMMREGKNPLLQLVAVNRTITRLPADPGGASPTRQVRCGKRNRSHGLNQCLPLSWNAPESRRKRAHSQVHARLLRGTQHIRAMDGILSVRRVCCTPRERSSDCRRFTGFFAESARHQASDHSS